LNLRRQNNRKRLRQHRLDGPPRRYDHFGRIRTLALVALRSDNEKLSTETLAILQQQTLNRIVVVTDKALAKAGG
jgi:hypothetical protein